MLPRCSKLSFLTCLGVLALWLCLTTAASAFTINATSDLGGSISPSGMVSVPAGGDQTFDINPDTPYVVADVVIDNSSVGAITSYTFTNVTANHTIAASFVVPSLLTYDVPVTETLSAGTEMDFFSFTGTAGDEIVLNLRSKSNNLDPNMTLRDPSGAIVGSNNCDETYRTCGFSLPNTLAITGTYLVTIGETGLDNVGDYELTLEKLFPAIAPTALSHEVPVIQTLTHGTEMDFYSFTGTADDVIVLDVRSLTNNLDPNMTLRDPNGLVVGTDGCSETYRTCEFSFSYTLTTSGTYLVAIGETGWENVGDYEITLVAGTSGPVLLESSQDTYSFIQDAYDTAPTGPNVTDTIKIKAGELVDYEDLDFNREVIIRLEGGYDDIFSSVVSETTLNGTLTIWGLGNTVIIDKLNIK